MVALLVWSILSTLVLVTIGYLRVLDEDDPWWLPVAAPFIITLCALHNARINRKDQPWEHLLMTW